MANQTSSPPLELLPNFGPKARHRMFANSLQCNLWTFCMNKIRQINAEDLNSKSDLRLIFKVGWQTSWHLGERSHSKQLKQNNKTTWLTLWYFGLGPKAERFCVVSAEPGMFFWLHRKLTVRIIGITKCLPVYPHYSKIPRILCVVFNIAFVSKRI